MEKLIITHKNFQGEIIAIYGEENELLAIDFTQADLSLEQRRYFTNRMPPEYGKNFIDHFRNSAGECTLIVVPEKHEITFEMFWSRYGVKHNRIRCEKIWDRMSKSDKVKAYYGITAYFKFLERQPFNRQKLDPENYLKNKIWNNEWK